MNRPGRASKEASSSIGEKDREKEALASIGLSEEDLRREYEKALDVVRSYSWNRSSIEFGPA
jgi:hypothetical protein